MFINEKKLRQIIREEVQKANEVTVTWEKRRVDATGQPLANPEIKTEKSDLPSLMHLYIPRLEGTMRGLQEDVEKVRNRVSEQNNSLQAVSGILIGLEKAIRAIAVIANDMKYLSSIPEAKLIEGKDESHS